MYIIINIHINYAIIYLVTNLMVKFRVYDGVYLIISFYYVSIYNNDMA